MSLADKVLQLCHSDSGDESCTIHVTNYQSSIVYLLSPLIYRGYLVFATTQTTSKPDN